MSFLFVQSDRISIQLFKDVRTLEVLWKILDIMYGKHLLCMVKIEHQMMWRL